MQYSFVRPFVPNSHSLQKGCFLVATGTVTDVGPVYFAILINHPAVSCPGEVFRLHVANI